VKHWVHCKLTSHPPHQISLCPLLSGSEETYSRKEKHRKILCPEGRKQRIWNTAALELGHSCTWNNHWKVETKRHTSIINNNQQLLAMTLFFLVLCPLISNTIINTNAKIIFLQQKLRETQQINFHAGSAYANTAYQAVPTDYQAVRNCIINRTCIPCFTLCWSFLEYHHQSYFLRNIYENTK